MVGCLSPLHCPPIVESPGGKSRARPRRSQLSAALWERSPDAQGPDQPHCSGQFLESQSQSHGLDNLGLGGGRSLVTPAFFKPLKPPVARLEKQGLQEPPDLSLISWSCLLHCLQPFPRQRLNRPTWLLSTPVAPGHINSFVLENSGAQQAGLLQLREGRQDHRLWTSHRCYLENITAGETLEERQRRRRVLHRGSGLHHTSSRVF